MTKGDITAWALANGWQLIDGAPQPDQTPRRRIPPLCAWC